MSMPDLALFGGSPVRSKPFPSWPRFDASERAALLDVLESGVWGGYSPKVKEFERRFMEAHGCRYGVSACNGTLSIECALTALGVGRGDEVIVPPVTFVATATAVLRAGAIPVFADIDARTYNLDPAQVAEAITPRTRAIIPVHFAGHPADMDALMPLARSRQLAVVEDCAHAHGASWRGVKAGGFGDFGSFSFQQSKNMTAGEGGMLLTNDPALAEKAWSFANQGRSPGGAWFQHDFLGTNLRMTGFQAAVLLAQMGRLEEQLAVRARNAAWLSARLSKSDLVSPPAFDSRVTAHGLYLYMIRLNREKLPGLPKELFLEALAAEGIPGAAGYPYPLYRNGVFRQYEYRRGECPNAEMACADCFWLSHQVLLADEAELEDVAQAIEKVGESAELLSAHAAGNR
ncbi:MAG: DegT/DnrJ/EryC1/StrS family aminotransferase [Bryobacteraceae bacterium]